MIILSFSFCGSVIALFCICSAAIQQLNTSAGKGEVEVLNVDTNRRVNRPSDRIAATMPLIIRHVAGSAANRSHADDELVVSADVRADGCSNVDKQDDRLVHVNDGRGCGPQTRASSRNTAADVDIGVTGGEKVEAEMVNKAVMSEHVNAEDISFGHTTNAADRAIHMAPFTHASRAVSLMISEVADVDSDEENDVRNVLPAVVSRSPVGSSSSAQMSGHRSVHHMLRQIQDAGDRINERLSSRDFGVRRRLPVAPVDAIHDSDVPTSSQSAKSDVSGELHPEYRPVRSILEELPRPGVRSPRSLVKNPTSLPGVSRQLPDPSAMKHFASSSEQPTATSKPENLKSRNCRAYDFDAECNSKLLYSSSLKCSVPALSICDADVLIEGKQPECRLDCLDNDAASFTCERLSHPTTRPSAVPDNEMTQVQPVYVDNVPVYLGGDKPENLKLLGKLTKTEAFTESKELTDPPFTCTHCVSVNSHVPAMSQKPALSVDFIPLERWPAEDVKWSDSLHSGVPVSRLIGRGVADGESPRNSMNDELDGKTEHARSLIMKPNDVDSVSMCPYCYGISGCQCATVVTDSNALKCYSAESCQSGPNGRKIETISECALDQIGPGYLSSSSAANDRADSAAVNECDGSVRLQTDPLPSSLTTLNVAGIWHCNTGRTSEGNKVIVGQGQCVPQTHDQAVKPLSAVPTGSTDVSLSVNSSHRADGIGIFDEHLEHSISFDVHNVRLVQDKGSMQSVVEVMHDGSRTAATVAVNDKLKSSETYHRISPCHETLLLPSSCSLDSESFEPNPETSKCIETSPDCGLKADELLCLAGPKRALSTQNTTGFALSGSAVVKTGVQAASGVVPGLWPGVMSSHWPGVSANQLQLSSVHVPVIKGITASNTTAVSSTSDKLLAAGQRKPGSTAMKAGQTGLSRLSGLNPPIRVSVHSPQPPTEPASRPAVIATQARFVYCFCN